ncbi:mannonate dehydratase [Teredinibacter turnerae T7901]|uniref:Mannonate dehydratase n=1 Tax=Teredinibacter turnerae (strain ATCC 39867 / T7901) TaxID=377629 RepID=C5BKW8_TERTT|nr:mannonate dehydratase [Teredinibacter turnerae]ACR13260.1 mannonate dehydratase [Teredinibacter turnerae T7901]
MNAPLMEHTMRWFGPADPVSLSDLRQAGCAGVVTALHHIPNGVVWQQADIEARKREIEAAGMRWNVVESLPVHEDIKSQQSGFEQLIENYKESLRNLAACDVRVVTYNFMPLLDWTRTDLGYAMPDGGKALRFDMIQVAAYDIHILQRPDAAADYSEIVQQLAAEKVAAMSDDDKIALEKTIVAGLPGSEVSFSTEAFLEAIMAYHDIGPEQYKANLIYFLQAICPLADELGIKLVVHPDDPPFAIYGLPRVVSTAQDLRDIFSAVPNPSNGLCFCAGSFSIRADNNLTEMVREFGERIHFIHLRNTQREEYGSFHESQHLNGSIDMYDVVNAIMDVSEARNESIAMRPDHGHQILDDLKKRANPGYSAIGRLKGLAELRGLELGIYRARQH